jgi:GR25 family glycosyltransferase involved in LPS biosynthesis
MKKYKNMYDIAILINLDRREDRKEWILNHFEKRGLTNVYVYPAFDGSEINHLAVKPPKRNYFSWTTMNKNVIACALSHIGALKMAKSMGHKRVLILEDDAVLSIDIMERLKILTQLSY